MILNRCRGCGCPLDPGERYCEECEEKMMDPQGELIWDARTEEKKKNSRNEGKCE